MIRYFSSFKPPFGLSPTITHPVCSYLTGQVVKQVSLNPDIFNQPIRRDIVHNVFHYYRCMDWQTTHGVIKYGDMAGSGKKMRQQKGSGKARLGYKHKAHLKGGGKAHGPVPRDHSFQLNKKLVLKALKIMFSARLFEGKFKVIDHYPEEYLKTKDIHSVMKNWGRSLLIHPQFSQNFVDASNNLKYLKITTNEKLNIKDLVKQPQVLITEEGLKELEENIERCTKKLYMNRKMYRKIKEEAKPEVPIEKVEITFKPLQEIVKKLNLDP